MAPETRSELGIALARVCRAQAVFWGLVLILLVAAGWHL